jgi:hypothetical protein
MKIGAGMTSLKTTHLHFNPWRVGPLSEKKFREEAFFGQDQQARIPEVGDRPITHFRQEAGFRLTALKKLRYINIMDTN